MERSIGATELRQRLTDVLQAVREGGETYIVETFDRAQAALINLDDYQHFQRFQQEGGASLVQPEVPAAPDDEPAPGLSYQEVLAIIDQVRQEVASGALASGEQMEVVEAIARLFEAAYQRGRSETRTLAFERILARATDLGITDISEQHDHYLYGVDKR
jgi:antitoxin (DNA-binding transcriptional repressor) of toxin-antitoxin stability system